jgi:hypothetical protein
MVQLSATRCSCIAILWVSLVSFTSITLCIASPSNNKVTRIFRYRLSPETFGHTHHVRTYTHTHTHTHVYTYTVRSEITPKPLSFLTTLRKEIKHRVLFRDTALILRLSKEASIILWWDCTVISTYWLCRTQSNSEPCPVQCVQNMSAIHLEVNTNQQTKLKKRTYANTKRILTHLVKPGKWRKQGSANDLELLSTSECSYDVNLHVASKCKVNCHLGHTMCGIPAARGLVFEER